MNEDFAKKIKIQINKSGFPLELDVIERISLLQHTVLPNISYIDKDNCIHEIDNITMLHRDTSDEWPFGSIALNLIMECKTSTEKPWIFFADPDPHCFHLIMGLVSNLKYMSDFNNNKGVLVGCMNTDLKNHHYNSLLPVCRTYCEAFGSDSGNNIYKAIQSVWRGINFYSTFLQSRRDKSSDKTLKSRTLFFHGVIVLKGNLILAQKTGNDFEVEEVPHILLKTIDCLTNTAPPFGPDRETIIDVIRENYLEEYISLCENDLSLCQRHLSRVYKAGLLDESLT